MTFTRLQASTILRIRPSSSGKQQQRCKIQTTKKKTFRRLYFYHLTYLSSASWKGIKCHGKMALMAIGGIYLFFQQHTQCQSIPNSIVTLPRPEISKCFFFLVFVRTGTQFLFTVCRGQTLLVSKVKQKNNNSSTRMKWSEGESWNVTFSKWPSLQVEYQVARVLQPFRNPPVIRSP